MTLSPPPGEWIPKVPPPVSTLPESSGHDAQPVVILESLRELRAEAQDLQAFLNTVRKGQVSIKTYSKYVDKTVKDMRVLVNAIQTPIQKGGTTSMPIADSIRHIQNLWEQISNNPLLVKPEEELVSQEQLHYLDMLEEQLRKMVFLIGFLTIPERLNHWLTKARTGYYIPFHLVFEDELPLLEDRVRLLNHLAFAPEEIRGGIVDPANGLIYRYSNNSRERWLSLLYMVLGLVGSTTIVYLLTKLNVSGWPLKAEDLGTMLIGWGAVLLGAIVHIAVGGAKRAQSQAGLPPILAMGNILLIIDSRIGEILLKLLMALIGFFGLVFASGITNITPLNSFLVGYTLDSFVELFSASIEQRAAAQATTIKQQLGVGGNT